MSMVSSGHSRKCLQSCALNSSWDSLRGRCWFSRTLCNMSREELLTIHDPSPKTLCHAKHTCAANAQSDL